MKGIHIYLIVILLVFAGCSMYSSNPFGTAYHNTTAHYNAYFIAQEHMKEIEMTLYDKYEWNYNKVLPIYPPIDSNDVKSVEPAIEDCIEKASIAIQRHVGSRWEDDSYILVGLARYYSLDYPNAIETFKYVNKKGENDDQRHEALIYLIRTFVDFNEFNNAIAVSDFLKKEKLNARNERLLHTVRAYLYQKRNDLDMMVQNLVLAENLMPRHANKARINFIIGQVYQQLGFEAEAYNFYQNTLKNSPDYELAFYTKLNMAQVTQFTSSGDKKRIRKYFKKLLKDPKNKEYQDKIYYEMGGFEFKQGNLEEAISLYKLSAKSSFKNKRQKAYAYLKLGQIYYDSLKNFQLAKNYYDSTVISLPTDEENYTKIKHRQEVLAEFVKQYMIIETNDSLISLSRLPQDSLLALATKIVREEALKETARREKAKRKELIANQNAFDTEDSPLIGTTLEGSTWYFYTPSALSKGSTEFKRIWGNRPLEDNWRLSQKSLQTVAAQTETVDKNQKKKAADEPNDEESQINSFLAAIPSSEEAINGLMEEIESAYFKLGNIYNFDLNERQNAIVTFEKLLERFPETDHYPEVLYQLFLLYNVDQPAMAKIKGDELKERFPETIYAKLIDNPNYREESQAVTAQLEKVYTKAYQMYKKDAFQASYYLLDSALQANPENSFSDNLALLQVLNIGQLEGQLKYQLELNNFLNNYPTSELYEYATTLVSTSEAYQINLFNSARARYIEYFNQKHYLAVIYPNKDELSQQIPQEINDFIKQNSFKMTTGSLVLDDSYAIILINDFPARASSMTFLDLLNKELPLNETHKGEKIYTFTISEDNFDILYQTKDLNAYLNFFDKHYLK